MCPTVARPLEQPRLHQQAGVNGIQVGLAWQALPTSGEACWGPAGPPTQLRKGWVSIFNSELNSPITASCSATGTAARISSRPGCPAVQGSHREGPERSISQVLQPAVSGAEEVRWCATRHRFVYTESAPGGAALQNGNPGVRSSSYQEPTLDRKRCLSPCPNAQDHQKVPAIQSEQEDLPVNMSTIRIGNVTSGVHQASKTRSGVVKVARCQAARLLGRLADLSLQNRPRCIPRWPSRYSRA